MVSSRNWLVNTPEYHGISEYHGRSEFPMPMPMSNTSNLRLRKKLKIIFELIR